MRASEIVDIKREEHNRVLTWRDSPREVGIRIEEGYAVEVEEWRFLHKSQTGAHPETNWGPIYRPVRLYRILHHGQGGSACDTWINGMPVTLRLELVMDWTERGSIDGRHDSGGE